MLWGQRACWCVCSDLKRWREAEDGVTWQWALRTAVRIAGLDKRAFRLGTLTLCFQYCSTYLGDRGEGHDHQPSARGRFWKLRV